MSRASRRCSAPSVSWSRRLGCTRAVGQSSASFYSSAGFSDERVWLYLARELKPVDGGAQPEEDERIEIVPWPLDRLGEAVSECQDAKSLIALLWLVGELARGTL